MENNPFDYTSVTDIETLANIERSIVIGKAMGRLVRYIGRQFCKVGKFLNMVSTCNEVAANSEYYTSHPEELKNKLS